MWMSNVIIVIDQNNADRNRIADLAAAIAETGAAYVNVDEACGMIEAAVPAQEVPTIAAMVGVSYVRSVFTYVCENSTEQAA
jgi:type III secretory pathway component EscR